METGSLHTASFVIGAIAGVAVGLAVVMILRERAGRARLREVEAALQAGEALLAGEAARRKAITAISLRLQQAASLDAFGNTLLSELAREASIAQAVLCVATPGRDALEALAHYAGGGATPAESLASFPATGSLLLRCVATAEAIVVEDPGPGYASIRSGLGHAAPATLLLLPIRLPGRVCAVIEAAFPVPMKPAQRQILDDLEPVIALSLERLLHRNPVP